MQRLPSRTLTLAFGCWALLLAAFAHSAPPVTVKDVRVWAGPDATRLVFDLSAPVEHSVMTLQNPDRVVIDIASAHIDATRALPEGQGFVKQLRVGPQGRSDVRFVIDLASPASPNTFDVAPSGSYGHRLVVDLNPIASSAPPVAVKTAEQAHGRDVIVAIDAGHGGDDPGAVGHGRLQEADVTLAISKKLKAELDQIPGITAVLTRTGDYFIPLRKRIEIARRYQADVMVSVHCNASRNRSATGTEVYFLSLTGATDEAARAVAEAENAADLIGGVPPESGNDLLSILFDLRQNDTIRRSSELAEHLIDALEIDTRLATRGVKQAGFVVLKAPEIPSVLVETAFITNAREAAMLKDTHFQRKMAEMLATGIQRFKVSRDKALGAAVN
jgi:N-acetylmuramoyl-L-alanine amidase